MPKSFRRTLGRHCSYALLESSELQCRFRQSVGTDRPCTLALCAPSPLARAPHALLDGHRRRWRRASSMPVASAVAGPPVAAKRSQHRPVTLFCATLYPLALRVAHACQRTPAAPSMWPDKNRARPLPPTGPRRPVLSNPLRTPNPSLFSLKTEPVELHIDAQLPKPPRPSSAPP